MIAPTSRRSTIDKAPRQNNPFDDFYRREYSSMVAIARALLRDMPSAEDLTQESFIAAHRNWDKISGYEDPRAWVRRVMMNRATSLRRRLGTEVRALTRIGVEPSAEPDLTPETDQVWLAVRRLPRRQAQAIVLHYVGELSTSEIGEVLGCAPGTVKTHLLRGRKKLERDLSDWRQEQR